MVRWLGPMGEGARLLHGWEGEYEMTARTVTLAEINNGGAAQFVDVLGDVFENSPWLVERAAAARQEYGDYYYHSNRFAELRGY